MLDRSEDIARLIESIAEPLDIANVVRHARRKRRIRRVIGATAGSALIIGAVIALMTVRDEPSSHLRIAGRAGTTIASSPPTTAPLVYRDRTKPPRLRVEVGDQLLDIETTLGCWSWVDDAGLGHGVCADGVVDPARFVVDDTGATRLTVSSPLPGRITARIADAPPPHGPHELAQYDAKMHQLTVRALGAAQWRIDLPPRTAASAVYIDLIVERAEHSVHGDASYGFELQPPTRTRPPVSPTRSP